PKKLKIKNTAKQSDLFTIKLTHHKSILYKSRSSLLISKNRFNSDLLKASTNETCSVNTRFFCFSLFRYCFNFNCLLLLDLINLLVCICTFTTSNSSKTTTKPIKTLKTITQTF